VIDLYRCEKQQSFLAFEDAHNIPMTEEKAYFQAKIKKADELVFVFPYWWGSAPAIMQNFIAWNFSKGFAFHYVNGRPQGLLQGKTVKIFSTSGAPTFVYMITGARRWLKNTWKSQIVEFCGMKLTSFELFGGVDTGMKNVEKILESVKKAV
jgi:NAD(P)H dehydrogenase (quinone)